MKKQNGITLIALVITIIVLLILAGVSIAMLTGDNGILTQASNAKEDTAKAEVVERINLSLNTAKAEYMADKTTTLAEMKALIDTDLTGLSGYSVTTSETAVTITHAATGATGSITSAGVLSPATK